MRREKPLWRDPSVLIFLLVAAGAWLLWSLSGCPAAEGAMTDCIAATCRIRCPDGGTGTGCAFERSEGQIWVLTNSHVVANSREVTCVFWRDGHESRPIRGRVTSRASGRIDAAIISIPESAFGRFPPKIIPLAPRGYSMQPGQTITSAGCAKGAWSTAWKGHATGPANFVPAPADGRSGSALFDARGEKIVGLIWGRRDEEGRGYAVTVGELYRGLAVRKTALYCGPGECPEETQLFPVLPYRRFTDQRFAQLQQQQRPQQQPINIYPTLPPQQYAPAPVAPAPSLDLTATNQRLDRIATLLEAMMAAGATDRPRPPPPAEAETKQAIVAVQGTQSKILSAIDQLVGDRDTLVDRFQARVEKVREEQGQDATTRQLATAYLRDLGAEKAPDIGRAVGGGIGSLTGNAMLAAALAAAGGMIGHGIKRRIKD